MSGSIDASIPLRAGQGITPIANPLTQYADFAHLQSAVNQNALFPGAQQLQQQAIQKGATELALQKNGAVNSFIGPLLSDPDLTLNKLTAAYGNAHLAGLDVGPHIDNLATTFPVNGTPAERHQWAVNMYAPALSPAQTVAMSPPKLEGFVDTGGQKLPYFTGSPLGPNAGQALDQSGRPFNAGKPVDLTVSPETAAKSDTRVDARGKPVTAPASTFMDPRLVPPAVRTAPSGGTTTMGTGRYAQPPQTDVPGAGGAPSTADPNLVLKNKEDVEAYNTAQKGVQASVGDTQTLGHALEALKILHDATLSTGPGTDTMHKMFAYLQTVGGLPPGMTDNVANWELAKKALTAFAASQGNQAHTDMGLATAAASNASVDGVTNQAAQTVVKQKLGQIRQSVAQVNEHADNTGVGYNEHASKFIQNTDPRAFAFDEYTPQERAQIIDTLGKPGSAAYNRFNESLRIARRNKFISPPGQ